jgi:hypothetical protein
MMIKKKMMMMMMMKMMMMKMREIKMNDGGSEAGKPGGRWYRNRRGAELAAWSRTGGREGTKPRGSKTGGEPPKGNGNLGRAGDEEGERQAL